MKRQWLTAMGVFAIMGASACTSAPSSTSSVVRHPHSSPTMTTGTGTGTGTATTGAGTATTGAGTATTGAGTATFQGLTLRFPTDWYSVPVSFLNGGVTPPLGYITTQRPIAQCRPSPDSPTGHIGCGAPVDALGEDDVLVIVNTGPLFAFGSWAMNTTIAGRPAQLLLDPSHERGLFGATNITEATINVGRRGVIQVVAFLRDNDPQRRQAIVRMLRTATYKT